MRALYRYPVKGLSPEPQERFDLVRDGYVPGDRLYAIENGPAGFDPAEPRHHPKTRFLMLMRNEALARLRTRYLDDTTTLVIGTGGRELRADLSNPDGREAVEAFMHAYMPQELRGPARVLRAPDGFRFTDSRRGFVSLINLASVRALADAVGRPVDPLRFRGNVLVDGLPAWAELNLVGTPALRAPSGLVLKITRRIVRCPATNVDPTSGARDMDIPRALDELLGHRDLGVYAEVTRSGTLKPGDELRPVQETLPV